MEQERVGRLISYIYRENQKALAKELLPYGLGGGGQYGFLKLILGKPGITQEQMTAEMKFDKATTARAVKHLEAVGYIERRPDPRDRRSSLLYPTAKATGFAPVLQAILDRFNVKLISGLTSEEEQQLLRLLRKVSRNAAVLSE
ncbi:MarR family winged helix-turn-helix transcriptional regulator [Cohnella fermenti]|uniref:Winged helix-turn-helix transcriptional regulator n=1 Tax=Cohnella fermenti TaxID=2565925 RepID=A0A4S4BS97_9BACL|nr:MarR family winged helix-turn-helix transcriptional regulator [Cohnella fermenti]THF77356.1 winged helix-turn-helix transcriptional regulator [Cohnella fermenti]